MHGKSGRVDSDFDEMADAYMLLQHGMRNLKMLAMLGVHSYTVHQLVAVGEKLLIKSVLQSC